MSAPLLLVSPRIDLDGGGRERYAAEFVAAARQRGVDVQVATVGRGLVAVRRVERFVARWRAAHPRAPVLTFEPIAGATHYQMHSGLLAESFAAEGRAFPSALRRRLAPAATRLNTWRRWLLARERALLGDGRVRIMAFAERDAALAVDRYGADRARVTVDRPGIDLARFHARGRVAGEGGVRALFAGHHFALKGLARAIGALARHPDVTLTVAGRGPAARYQRLARRLGVAARVQVAGVIPAARMPDLYRAHDVLLHPAYYDPCPRVVAEALACGCAVITTPECGASEWLRPGVNGWIISDDDAMAHAIGLLRHPDTRAAAAAAAAETGATLDFGANVQRVLSWLGDPAAG